MFASEDELCIARTFIPVSMVTSGMIVFPSLSWMEAFRSETVRHHHAENMETTEAFSRYRPGPLILPVC